MLAAPPSWTRKAERIVGLAQPFLDQTFVGQRLHLARDPRRIGEDAAHREHHQRADAVLPRDRKHVLRAPWCIMWKPTM